MKRYAIAMVLLAFAGVLFAQEAPDAEKPQAPAAESAAEVKEAPAAAPAAEGDFCCRERMQDGKPFDELAIAIEIGELDPRVQRSAVVSRARNEA